jgi:Predicted periplasmic lipoprotein (DUF2279)
MDRVFHYVCVRIMFSWLKVVLIVLIGSSTAAVSFAVRAESELDINPADNPGQQAITIKTDDEFLSAQKKRRTRWIVWGTVLSYAAYGYRNWWSEDNSNFNFANEQWFGEDSYAGGADKLGHTYAAYLSMRLMTKQFQWAGHDHADSLKLGAIVAGSVLAGVEVLDGFTQRFGFSREDLIMNFLGIGLGVLLEARPKWDALIDFRIQYWPSDDARKLGERDPISDYSGQTYFLVAKASGLPALRSRRYIRYFELALGYGSRGYEPDDGSLLDRERRIYYGISVNLSHLLDNTVFKQRQSSRTHNILHNVLEYYQVPGTAALAVKTL